MKIYKIAQLYGHLWENYPPDSINDKEYFDAVRQNNHDILDRLVEQQAFSKGYEIYAYHGSRTVERTGKPFYEFEIRWNMGAHFGTEEQANERAQEINPIRPLSVRPFYLKIRNPITLSDLGEWEIPEQLSELVRQNILTQEEADEIYNRETEENRPTILEQDEIRYVLIQKGVDAVEYWNTEEGFGGTSYIVFNPSQIKLAEHITYDDKNQIIPLSQRFNENSNDIRY